MIAIICGVGWLSGSAGPGGAVREGTKMTKLEEIWMVVGALVAVAGMVMVMVGVWQALY